MTIMFEDGTCQTGILSPTEAFEVGLASGKDFSFVTDEGETVEIIDRMRGTAN